MALIPISDDVDPTLEAADRALEESYNAQPRRGYLGMSSIGDSCKRKLWYRFRFAKKEWFNAKTIKAFMDGHLQEDVQAERLRAIPGIELETHVHSFKVRHGVVFEGEISPGSFIYIDERDIGNAVVPDKPKQHEFSWFNGAFIGHPDGFITGLLQAPKTKHVWEHKSVNEKKFEKLKKLKEEKGEKNAFRAWDFTYFCQGQLYMHFSGESRHYLTVSTPGGRDTVSCRTDYDKTFSLELIEKAESIIFTDDAPRRIGDSTWYECRWCPFNDICHEKAIPEVNCRTCLHAEVLREGGWKCAKFNTPIKEDMLCQGTEHLFLPGLLDGTIKTAETGRVEYEDGRINYCGGKVE